MTRGKPTATRVRLQKFLSEAGVASRRRAEELIEAGRLLVNGVIVDTLPAFVKPDADRVVVDGTPVRIRPLEYFLVHKPKGVVCTNRDPAGRRRAIDLLPPTRARLNVVGRLDAESTGLLLMTNDGELAERLTHPRYGVSKVYWAEVRGQVPGDINAKLKKGVYLAEGKATASEVEVLHRSRQASVLQIVLREGRNRQARRMLARLGHPVKKLKRVQIGPLTLKGLPVGAARRLTAREVRVLRRTATAAPTRTLVGAHRRQHAASKPRRAGRSGPKQSPKRASGQSYWRTSSEGRPRQRLTKQAASRTGRRA
jgi:23S rRNA pseudouridine2605 synthase